MTEEKQHRIDVTIALYGKFEGELPMESTLRTKLWNDARANGKFSVKIFDFEVGEVIKGKEIFKNELDEEDED